MSEFVEEQIEMLEKSGTKVFRSGKDYKSMDELINLLNNIKED